jgi:hypothetical protein
MLPVPRRLGGDGCHTQAPALDGVPESIDLVAGLPTPGTSQRIGDTGTIFWFMKAW